MDILLETKKRVDEAIAKFGEQAEFRYQTAYELPLFFAFTKSSIKNLGELRNALNSLQKNELSILFCAEALEAVKSLAEKNGFIPDSFLRKIGAPLVDGRIPGIAIVVGESNDCDLLVKQLQEKNFLILLAGKIIQQLESKNIKLGAELNLVPLGKDILSSVHALNLAVRVGLTFGGIDRSNKDAMMKYIVERLPAFVIQLGPVNDEIKDLAVALHMLNLLVLTDQKINADFIVSEPDHKKIIQKAIELKRIKVNVEKINIPIAYSMAFEGERIRKPDVYVEAGGGKSLSFELVKMKPQVEDGRVDLVGKDLDKFAEGSIIPIGIFVEVSGKNMQEDFEPVVERKIHDYINYGEGLMHVAQRNFVWLRVSKDAFKKGFRLKHLGEIIRKRFLSDFSGIIDKVQVTIFTDKKQVEQKLQYAMQEYAKRDSRLKGMTDETVDKFYTCSLCQSFATNHICIITPERLGLCGGISWLDAKASHEINPTGPNQVFEKGKVGDSKFGVWKNVDEAVKKYTHDKFSGFCMYSLMNKPCTSCGCFECIVAIMPECNGVLIVDRDFDELTPIGMKFTTLAGEVGGGVQTPGFMGIGRRFLLSKKFMQAEGGVRRIVWMPSKLKEFVKNNIDFQKLGLENDFLDKIADETTTSDVKSVLEFITNKKHPALSMAPILTDEVKSDEESHNAHIQSSDLQNTNQKFIAAEIIDGFVDKISTGEFEIHNNVAWAKQAVEKGAQLIYLKLDSINPDGENKPAQKIVELVKSLQASVNVPLIVVGCGNNEKDREVFEKIAPVLKNGYIGNADENNYKTYAGLSVAYNLGVVAFSNIDFNIAKQVNTLLRETGVNTNKIIMDPLTGALGYGLEYTYSVIERIKLGAKSGDLILDRPVLFNAAKAWDAREAKESKDSGVVWEKTTALAGLCSGANIIVARHPETIDYIKKIIKDF